MHWFIGSIQATAGDGDAKVLIDVKAFRPFPDGTVDISVGCSTDDSTWLEKITRCTLYGTRPQANANHTLIASIPGPNEYNNNNCGLINVTGQGILWSGEYYVNKRTIIISTSWIQGFTVYIGMLYGTAFSLQQEQAIRSHISTVRSNLRRAHGNGSGTRNIIAYQGRQHIHGNVHCLRKYLCGNVRPSNLIYSYFYTIKIISGEAPLNHYKWSHHDQVIISYGWIIQMECLRFSRSYSLIARIVRTAPRARNDSKYDTVSLTLEGQFSAICAVSNLNNFSGHTCAWTYSSPIQGKQFSNIIISTENYTKPDIQTHFGYLTVQETVIWKRSQHCQLLISNVTPAAIGHWQCSPGPSDKDGYVLPSDPLHVTIAGSSKYNKTFN